MTAPKSFATLGSFNTSIRPDKPDFTVSSAITLAINRATLDIPPFPGNSDSQLRKSLVMS
jgi:hypothetical protein